MYEMLISKYWILKGYPIIDYINAFLTDTEVAAAAGIAKSKLGALEIADADVAVGAEIAKNKLADLAIVNADIATDADFRRVLVHVV